MHTGIFRTIGSLFVLLLMLTSCSFRGGGAVPDLNQKISTVELLSGEALFGPQVESIELPEDNVLQVGNSMRDFAKDTIPFNASKYAKVKTLLKAVLGPDQLGMKYNTTATFTARAAFEKAEGNCLSFSYLFVALARDQGLRVNFREVDVPPEWDNMNEEMYFHAGHVNVQVSINYNREAIVDIDKVRNKPSYEGRLISDNHARALYYSNIGAEHLQAGDQREAFRYFAKALDLAPEQENFWSNLGVLYRMNGLMDHAESAYLIGLAINPSSRTVLNNIVALYEHKGEPEKVSHYAGLVYNYQMKNPYFRYMIAQEEFDKGLYDESLRHLKFAIKRKKKESKFYQLMGLNYQKMGLLAKSEAAFSQARKLQ